MMPLQPSSVMAGSGINERTLLAAAGPLLALVVSVVLVGVFSGCDCASILATWTRFDQLEAKHARELFRSGGKDGREAAGTTGAEDCACVSWCGRKCKGTH